MLGLEAGGRVLGLEAGDRVLGLEADDRVLGLEAGACVLGLLRCIQRMWFACRIMNECIVRMPLLDGGFIQS